MKRLLLPMIAVLSACDGSPLAPGSQPASITSPIATVRTSSIVTVSARNQLVTLRFTSGETAEAYFKARFDVSTSAGSSAQMDGAILVVSAADGPMPQIGGESLAIDISRATINRNGVVQFEGTATVSDGRVILASYPSTGSARPSGSNPDYIVWDIVGGNVSEVEFEALTRISAPK
jgi:hypothetical protein